jgi:1-phosphofructokinase
MIYTITISPAIDYIMRLDHMEAGATNRSNHEEYYFGGKGINVSVMLKHMGIESIALGFVAGFTGKALEEGLHEQGIRTDFVHLAKGITRINVKLKSELETEINGQGALPEMSDFHALARKLEKLEDGDILIISGSIPKALPKDTYGNLLGTISGKDILTVVDTSGELLTNILAYRPFLVKPNIDELHELFGEDIAPLEGARKLQVAGARNVIVSLGAKGAMLLSEKGKDYYCGVPSSGKMLNTVGSGDSMVAGFIAGFQRTKDYQEALDLGGAAGSATAYSPGLADKETIDACLAEIKNERKEL